MSGERTASPARRLVATVLLFAFIMPAIGIAIAVLSVAVTFGFGPQSIFRAGETLSVFTSLGYAIGVIPAALVGAAVGWRDRTTGATWRFAAAAGFVAGIAFAAILLIVGYDQSVVFVAAEIAAVVISVIGALVAWKATRGFRQAATGGTP